MSRDYGTYPVWLRCWHWGNALLFVAQLVTGLSLHYATPGGPHAGFRAAMLVHNTAGILLTAFYGWFLFGNVRYGNGRFYLLAPGDLTRGLLLQARYYLFGIFRGDPHPFPHNAERKFNPMQKMSYLVVMGLLFPPLIVSGWALFFPARLPASVFGIPGVAICALAHTYLGFCLSLFMLTHMYLATTGDTVGELFRVMLVGASHSHEATQATPPTAEVRPTS
ncbi:MAG TPA: cytochrome b/b6 domain-containing protein [Candidatus Margulisiibacteriota bacterium]|nr:cytochrome b/b6 domain-containing protein [Candidatus Margulisiibacteriota bacterium]